MSRRGITLAVIVLLVMASATWGMQTRDLPRAEGQRSLRELQDRYGELAPDHPTMRTVQSIFDTLVRVAERYPGPLIEIHVLNTSKIIAQSLPGNLIVLSRGVVDLAGSDDALAFVLAHELAHAVRDHHGTLDSLGVFGASTTAVPADEVARAYRSIEREADRFGVLYTALAGYQTSRAIPVINKIIERAGSDQYHPNPSERAEAVRDQLNEIVDHFQVFPFGLFLLATGRYLEAARVLEIFLSGFPSREVMSAIGVAYHKDALSYIANPPVWRHLLAVDAATRAPTMRGGVDRRVRERLDRAIKYYKRAVDADPSYAPALNNLAMAYLDLGEREEALRYIERALSADKELASAYNNRAIAAAMKQEYESAQRDFLRARELAPGVREISCNLAHLYAVRGLHGQAPCLPQTGGSEIAPKAASPISGPIMPGQRADLSAWQRDPEARQIPLPLGDGTARDLTLWVLSRRGPAVVVRDGVIDTVGILSDTPPSQMKIVSRVRLGDPAARIKQEYAPPDGLEGLQFLKVSAFRSRRLAFFVVDDRVQAIWTSYVTPPQSPR